ncbi:MAG: signal recognition particle protein, partial [Chlorobiales bacterium]|nr:signal recognition particle protein [Chlorobiales bacterium]
MFESLSDKLESSLKKLSGQAKINEINVGNALRDIKRALLDADVNFKVVKDFIEQVREKALGEDVIKSVSPAQMIVKIVHDELVRLMGPVDSRIPWVSNPPTIILMAGLQGSGKTTTCAKLAKFC